MKFPRSIHESWHPKLKHLIEDERFAKIAKELSGINYSPAPENIFKCLSIPLDKVKVVIIGLAPYQHMYNGDRVATGLAFAVSNPDCFNNLLAKSLNIMMDSLAFEYGDITAGLDDFDYTLQNWHNQGVMLMNTALTVPIGGDPKGHLYMWKWFTSGILKALCEDKQERVFSFWGRDAETIVPDNPGSNIFLYACHPVATSYAFSETDKPKDRLIFWNYKPFTSINNALKLFKYEQIRWYL